ncbi:MAG: HAMP domain-containing histidine kinase [Oscillospiraceae bacterium]|nr:HAMP domain-containing histidine kinase [Oscillospiraceae bacterium]
MTRNLKDRLAELKASRQALINRRKDLAVRIRNWLMGFSVVILTLLWLLQFAFFNSFYESLRLIEIRVNGRQIVREYEGQGNFRAALQARAFRQNLRILLLDEAGWILENYDGFGTPFLIGGGRLDLDGTPAGLIREGQTEHAFIRRENGGGSAVYLAKVAAPAPGSERYLYVSSLIPPNDATVTVLTMQFIIITAALLLFSMGAAWLLSKRISEPIVSLTASARHLAKGNFKAAPSKRDYTEIAELSRELSRATEEITKAERYRQEIVANVSHDLKTPLTIIRFYGEMLRDVSGGDAEKRGAHCEKIIAEADRLTGMVNELLELSKLEAAGSNDDFPIVMEPLDLSALLRETLERFAALQEKEGYRFEADIAPGFHVRGSGAYLSRAVYNLIANAVNHTGEDRRVIVRLRAAGRQGAPAARVEIADTGDGIPPEELPRIWERYYRTGQTHRRSVVGTGLGLSIVQTALQKHNAAFGVSSSPGQGSMFWFEMALAPPEA